MLVLARFWAYNAGGVLVPKYRSYNVALLDADQPRVGVVDWLIAPLAGEVRITCEGRGNVVNEKVLDATAEPPLFFVTTFQE